MFKGKLKQKPSKKNFIIVCLILLIILLGIVVFLLLRGSNKDLNGFQYESNATIGLLPGVDRDALLAQMQEYTDRSAIAYVLNVRPELNKKGTIDILFENPEGNQKDLILELIDDESGESIYKSGALAEGRYIETVKISTKYEPGTYTLTAFLTGYELETHNIIGQTAAEVIMKVK